MKLNYFGTLNFTTGHLDHGRLLFLLLLQVDRLVITVFAGLPGSAFESTDKQRLLKPDLHRAVDR